MPVCWWWRAFRARSTLFSLLARPAASLRPGPLPRNCPLPKAPCRYRIPRSTPRLEACRGLEPVFHRFNGGPPRGIRIRIGVRLYTRLLAPASSKRARRQRYRLAPRRSPILQSPHPASAKGPVSPTGPCTGSACVRDDLRSRSINQPPPRHAAARTSRGRMPRREPRAGLPAPPRPWSPQAPG